jgi:hypothetical protein
MLTTIVLRDDELATLSRTEVLGLEHLLHEHLSEAARTRKSGDSALLLAIKAADYLAPLLDELGDDATGDLLHDLAESDVGHAAFDRVSVVVELTASHAA